jgi:hypothetical protein
VKLEILAQELRFASPVYRTRPHLTVPARDRRYFRLDFIEKLCGVIKRSGGLATGMEVSFATLRRSSSRQLCLMDSVN